VPVLGLDPHLIPSVPMLNRTPWNRPPVPFILTILGVSPLLNVCYLDWCMLVDTNACTIDIDCTYVSIESNSYRVV
jgi:hypothetical protein